MANTKNGKSNGTASAETMFPKDKEKEEGNSRRPLYNIYSTVPRLNGQTSIGNKIGVALPNNGESLTLLFNAMPIPHNGVCKLLAFKPKDDMSFEMK